MNDTPNPAAQCRNETDTAAASVPSSNRPKASRPPACACTPAALPHRFDRFAYCPDHHVLFALDRRSTPAQWVTAAFESPTNGLHCQLRLAAGRLMVAHRVVFSCVHGAAWAARGLVLTHRDRNPLNNRLANLRLVTPTESAGLARGWKGRASPKNVYANKGGFLAQVQSGGKVFSKWFAAQVPAAEYAAHLRERLFGIPALAVSPVAPA